MERAPTPLTKTVEVQTDYRDSEAQTDPYTPEYVVRPGSAPELLTLATLSFGKFINEPPRGKTNNVVSEQVRHKPACTRTEKS